MKCCCTIIDAYIYRYRYRYIHARTLMKIQGTKRCTVRIRCIVRVLVSYRCIFSCSRNETYVYWVILWSFLHVVHHIVCVYMWYIYIYIYRSSYLLHLCHSAFELVVFVFAWLSTLFTCLCMICSDKSWSCAVSGRSSNTNIKSNRDN
jgi:hypothetical protein